MLIGKIDSLLVGFRMYNKSGIVIFTTGYFIEDNDYRNLLNYQVTSIYFEQGERIIGIRSHDDGGGFSSHKNF